MSVVQATTNGGAGTEAASAIDPQLRGSSLLLLARGLSLGLNMVVEVLIVRALSKNEYGALAYALSFVVSGQAALTFSLDSAIGRIYHDEKAYDKPSGVILMALGVIVSLGAALVISTRTLRGVLGSSLIHDPRA